MVATADVVRKGTLTFGTAPSQIVVSCRPTSVLLNPTANEVGDRLEVLCGDTIDPEVQIVWTIDMTAVQDWEQPVADSLQKWALANKGTVQAYEWKPSDTSGTFKGDLTVQPIAIGGAVGTKATVDFSWKLTAEPVYTEPPVVPASAAATTTTAKSG